MLGKKKPLDALSIFQLNAKLYLKSANAYDSFGEIMELTGNKKEAIRNYQKSVALDPENKNAVSRINIRSGK